MDKARKCRTAKGKSKSRSILAGMSYNCLITMVSMGFGARAELNRRGFSDADIDINANNMQRLAGAIGNK